MSQCGQCVRAQRRCLAEPSQQSSRAGSCRRRAPCLASFRLGSMALETLVVISGPCLSPVECQNPDPQGFGIGPLLKALLICHSCEWLAGLTAPVGVALLLVVFLGGADPASPPYRTQRVVFAWLVDVPVADPIRGQSSTDLSDRRSFVARYRLRRPCVYPAVPGCKISRWPARWLVTLCRVFVGMGCITHDV